MEKQTGIHSSKNLLLVFFLFLYLMPFLALADENVQSVVQKSEGGFCSDCQLPGTDAIKQSLDIRKVRNAIIGENPAKNASAALSHLRAKDACVSVVSEDSYGPLGQEIIMNLESGKFEDLLLGAEDLKLMCPGYESMSRPQKEGLFVTIFTAMMFLESSCEEKPKPHQGPYGTLAGLFQLDKGKEHNYAEGCTKNASLKPEESIFCAMSMLQGQILEEGSLWSKNSYWEVLRPRGRKKKLGKLRSAIHNYSLCY